MDDYSQTIKERDYYEDMADELANAIAEHFEADIGERSNVNNTFENALEWISPLNPIKTGYEFWCRRCGEKLEKYNYCPNCGQKIYWDNKDETQ